MVLCNVPGPDADTGVAALDSALMASWSRDFTRLSRGWNIIFLGVAPVVPRVTWDASPYCGGTKRRREEKKVVNESKPAE